MVLTGCSETMSMWRRAWVAALDHPWTARYPEPFRVIQNEGIGLLIQGVREWTDYRMSADVTPHCVRSCGIAARVQGLKRYYALLLCSDQRVRLIKALDGLNVLAEAELDWELGRKYDLALRVVGAAIRAELDGRTIFDVRDGDHPLSSGAVALVCEEGRTATECVHVSPV